jgi:hypothetical protein
MKTVIVWPKNTEELKQKLQDALNNIHAEIIKTNGKNLRTEEKQQKYKNLFKELFKQIQYPFDDNPDVEIIVTYMGHGVNANIVFIIKDEEGRKLRL